MYISNEQRKEEEVKSVRLDNIKLKNRLKKREQQLKAKEELAEGLHLIDFEQLKIENQTYNEKIEERNEVFLKWDFLWLEVWVGHEGDCLMICRSLDQIQVEPFKNFQETQNLLLQ